MRQFEGRYSFDDIKEEASVNPRLRRLQADYEVVRDVYSGHSHITVDPVGDRLPPETYRITYKLSGLKLAVERRDMMDVGDVVTEVTGEHEVELMLPRRYPAEKPYVVPKSPIFHPNVSEYYCLVDEENWSPSTKLVDLIEKIGDMIQLRDYNLGSPLDPLAARWVRSQRDTGLLPVGDVALGVEAVSFDFDSAGPQSTESRVLIDFDDSPADGEDFEINVRSD